MHAAKTIIALIRSEVTSFPVAVAVEKQQRFFVDNLMLGVQLAKLYTEH